MAQMAQLTQFLTQGVRLFGKPNLERQSVPREPECQSKFLMLPQMGRIERILLRSTMDNN